MLLIPLLPKVFYFLLIGLRTFQVFFLTEGQIKIKINTQHPHYIKMKWYIIYTLEKIGRNFTNFSFNMLPFRSSGEMFGCTEVAKTSNVVF